MLVYIATYSVLIAFGGVLVYYSSRPFADRGTNISKSVLGPAISELLSFFALTSFLGYFDLLSYIRVGGFQFVRFVILWLFLKYFLEFRIWGALFISFIYVVLSYVGFDFIYNIIIDILK